MLFSDESTFEIMSSKQRIFVRRRPGEKFSDQCVHPTVKHGGKNVMVWGCISGYGVGKLHMCQGHVNAQQYLSILQGPMLESARNLIPFPGNTFTFQEDNAPFHTARIVKTWMTAQEDFRRLPWPAQSPDMSPIESLWNSLKRKVHLVKSGSKDELFSTIQHYWNQYTVEDMQKLVDTMPRRARDLYRAKGGHTKW